MFDHDHFNFSLSVIPRSGEGLYFDKPSQVVIMLFFTEIYRSCAVMKMLESKLKV